MTDKFTQTHHLVRKKSKSLLIKELIRLGLFDFEDASNKIELPNSSLQRAGSAAALSANHTGVHKAYSTWFDKILNDIDLARIDGTQTYAWAAKEVKKAQVFAALKLLPKPGKNGVLSADFVLNNGDGRIADLIDPVTGKKGLSSDTIYERFFKKFEKYDTIKITPEFSKGLQIADNVDYKNLLKMSFDDGAADVSGLKLALVKLKIANDLDLSTIDGVDVSDINPNKLAKTFGQAWPEKLSAISNLLEAFRVSEGGSADIGGKFAGLSNKIGAVDFALIGLIGVGLYQISEDSGLTIEELLAELNIEISPQLLKSAALGIIRMGFEYAVLTVLSAGIGTVVKVGYEASESAELIGVTTQILDVAFPNWGLMNKINTAKGAVIQGLVKAEKIVTAFVVDAAISLAGANGLIISDGTERTELGRLVAEGDEGIDLLWGRGYSEIYGKEGNDWLFHTGSGLANGGVGSDVLIGWGAEYIKAGEKVGAVPVSGERDNRPTALSDIFLTIDGGVGDDWLIAFGGKGAVLVGGEGRDFIFNTSAYGKLYGDTVDGNGADGQPLNHTGKQNSDVFWFWPGTFIQDAQPNDILQIFGFPLTGGANAVLGVFTAWNSGYAMDWNFWNIFYRFGSSGQLQIIDRISWTLGIGPEGNDSLRGSQVVEKYDFGGIENDGFGTPKHGDLGMTFRIYSNIYLNFSGQGKDDAISLIKDAWGFFGARIDAMFSLAKGIHWQPLNDPLVLDLDGDGIETLSIVHSGVHFDFNEDFFAEKSGWLSGDDGFLVLDKNGNGIIDDVSEMFGGVDLSGFDDLASYDENNDGFITVDDSIFSTLSVWRDLDGDAKTDNGELFSLDDLGIVSIGVGGDGVVSQTPQGTDILSRGTFTREDGSTGNSFEAIFETDATDTVFRGDRGVADWLKGQSVPNAKGIGTMVNLAENISYDFELASIVAQAASAMTTVSLKDIRAQATPVFGAWAQSLELTRELAPVLLDTSGDNAVLVDYAVYVEDAQGGFWTLNSGDPINDADGNLIDRPDMQDVMGQTIAAGQVWQVEQMFSPSSRASDVVDRAEAPYLVSLVDGRAVIQDYGIEQSDGSWQLASGNPITDIDGNVIASPSRDDVLAQATGLGNEWRVESIGSNPFADLPVEHIGVQLIDGQVVDYSVQITDDEGSFYVWARNLDRALELQHKLGNAGEFSLRNYELDFDNLDEVGSTDDSAYRVELLTAGQLHFASSGYGIDFQPQIMSATIDSETGLLNYSVGSFNGQSASNTAQDGSFQSQIEPAIELFDLLMQSYINTSRAFAVRIALQGGLESFARGLEYDATSDEYSASTDRELAPMFEAIFEGAPSGAGAAYDYLKQWDEILEVVYADYHVDTTTNLITGSMQLDQEFVFQMVIPAFENVGIDADLPAVLNALGVDETRLVSHQQDDTLVEGTTGDDFFYLTGGDQTLKGGTGQDTYFVGKDFGHDTIEDVEYGFVPGQHVSSDYLRFTQVKSDQIYATRDGLDLVLEVIGTQDVLRVKNQFEGELLDPLFGKDYSPSTEMVSITFADGVIWDRFDIAMAVSHPLDSDDLVLGTQAKDFLEGGKGNDVLRGGRDGDTYIFRVGDGDDRISDDNDAATDDPTIKFDLLQFVGDIQAEDLQFHRAGESNDLEILILDDDKNLTGDRISIENQFQWISGPLVGLIFQNEIERIGFSQGGFLTRKEITDSILENAGSDGQDIIYGFNSDDLLDGKAGNDVLIGRAQDDTYVYGRDYGRDIIDDSNNDLFAASFDILEFQDDLRWTDFVFEREGDSATITMRVKGTDDAVILKDQYKSTPFIGFTNLIEQIDFADGTSWDYTKLAQHVIDLSASAGEDTIYGFEISDVLDGGAGNDRLEGGLGADTYVFARGYGVDTAFDLGSGTSEDKVTFHDISFGDVDISRAGNDLIFTVRDSGDQLVLSEQFNRGGGRQLNAIETFVFSDQTVKYENLNPEDVDLIGTSGDDTLIGSDFAELIDGRGGDDTLVGNSDGDTYLFDVGYGHDVIIDQQKRAAWLDRGLNRVGETDDTIRFGSDISIDSAVFTKDGDDLLISIVNQTDTLRVRNQFRSIEDGIEWYEFADGTKLHISDIEERLAIVGGSRGDDVITGAQSTANSLDGRQGDDQLYGGDLGDTYAFGTSYDFDQIIESSSPQSGAIDKVVFSSSVSPSVVQVLRDGNNLIFNLGNGQDQLTIIDGLSTKQVEQFLFADGSSWSLEDVRDRLLIGSNGDDLLVGFDDRNDVLDGQTGSDALEGAGGDDTYKFGIDSGSDSIFDSSGVDQIVFGDQISAQMVQFSDEGGDLLVRLEGSLSNLIIFGGAARASNQNHIEQFVFSDGTVLTMQDVFTSLVEDQQTVGNDVVDGQVGVPLHVRGGLGDDLLLGENGTSFIFRAGDGSDIIDTTNQSGSSQIIFEDLAPEDAVVRRIDIAGPDIMISFPRTGDQITIKGLLSNSNLDTVVFATGAVWSRAELVAAAIYAQSSTHSDVITGSDLDDVIIGGQGDDDIQGGLGDDTYYFKRGDGRDVIDDEGGFDRLEVTGFRSQELSVSKPVAGRNELLLSFANSSDEILVKFGNGRGIDIVAFGDGIELTLDQLQELAIGQGSPYDDVIVGNNNDNVLEGGQGNDALSGLSGDDQYIFERGSGRDIIDDDGSFGDVNELVIKDYTAADVTLIRFDDRPNDLTMRFLDGDEIIIRNAFSTNGKQISKFTFENGVIWDINDVLDAINNQRDSDANEQILGTSSDDTLAGGHGDDFVDGKTGDDTYVFSRGDGHDTIVDNGNGLDSADRLVLHGFVPNDVSVSSIVGSDDLLLSFLGSDDSITMLHPLADGVHRTIETIEFDNGIVWTKADLAAQLIAGFASDQDDNIISLASDDEIDGGLGNDVIDGGAGNDTLSGGLGTDFIDGGKGNDTFVFNKGDGSDTIVDNGDGLSTSDKLQIKGYLPNEVVVSLVAGTSDVELTFTSSSDKITLLHPLNDNKYSTIETYEFDDGTVWTKSDLANFLNAGFGSAGDDIINALGSDDVIDGAEGNDSITGGYGDDVLSGNLGNDYVDGGKGDDTYVFNRGDGKDIIVDNGNGLDNDDKLIIHGYLPSEVIVNSIIGSDDLTIKFVGSSDQITMLHPLASGVYRTIETIVFDDGTVWNKTDLGALVVDPVLAGNNQNITGTSAAEIFEAGLGNDYVSGQDGSDTYIFNQGDGQDVIEDNGYRDNDKLVINGYTAAETFVSRQYTGSLTLVLTFAGTDDQIVIRNTLNGSNYDQIESIEFGDGTVWSMGDVRALLVASQTSDNNDIVSGSAYGETLQAGLGDDVIFGLNGSDHYVFNRGDGKDTIEDNGSYDTDQVVIHGYIADEVSIGRSPSSSDTLVLTFAGTDDEITIRNTLDGDYKDQIEQVVFDNGTVWTIAEINRRLIEDSQSDGDDVIIGSTKANTLTGGLGNDRLFGDDGSDTYVFNAGDGRDFIEDNGNNDTDVLVLHGYLPSQVFVKVAPYDAQTLIISFANSQDQVTLANTLGQSAQDQIEEIHFDDGTVWSMTDVKTQIISEQGTDGNDHASGFETDDVFELGFGNDLAMGEQGNDTYIYNRGDGYDVIIDDALDNADRVVLKGISADQVILQKGVENDLEIIIPQSGVDVGDGGRITVRNSFLADSFNGIEQIVFDDGTIWQRDQFAILADRNVATVGDDKLDGSTANDRLEGMQGNDDLSGGVGDDVYVFSKGDGHDLIHDDGSGFDVLEVTGYGLDDVIFTSRGRDGQDLIIKFLDGAQDSITVINGLTGSAQNLIEQISFIDTSTGTSTNVSIEQIRAKITFGSQSDDDDQIIGSQLDDTLTGGQGNDLLVGRGGDDTYIYAAGDGDDQINDSSSSENDKLVLTDIASDELQWVRRSPANGTDLVLRFGDNQDRLLLSDSLSDGTGGIETIEFADGVVWGLAEMRAAVLSSATSDQSEQIRGFSSDDLLIGAKGDDLLIGYGGDDVYQFANGDGNDVVFDDAASLGDRVELVGLSSLEASVKRLYKGSDTIVVSFAGIDDTLTIRYQLDENGRGIEEIVFSDNVVWTQQIILDLLENSKPVAVDDGIFSLKQNQSVIISAADLLRNDFDADGDDLHIISVDGGEHGNAQIDGNGNVVFSGTDGFTGAAQFTYTVSDGHNGLATASVNVRVNPIAFAKDDYGFSVNEDEFETISTSRLLSNDIDGDRMIVAQVLNATNGNVSLSSNGEISFTPIQDFNGVASFTYVANTPEGGRAEAVVYIDVAPINDAPIGVVDSGFVTNEDVAFSIDAQDLLANDTDIDGDTLTITQVIGNEHLQVELSDDGVIFVTPTAFYFGDAQFEYTVSDGNGETATTSVSITVNPVNNDPEPVTDNLIINEDEPLLILNTDLTANDIERDGDPLTIVSVRKGYGGNVVLLENGTTLFTPSGNFFGQAHFFYTVDDGQGGSVEARVNVQVDPVNDAPIAQSESYLDEDVFFLNGTEDIAQTISITDLLQNDSDLESLNLSLVSVSFAENGTATIENDGTILFTPDADYWGEASFSYVISDAGGLVDDATVTLYFDPVGDAPPVAGDDEVTIYEDVVTTILASTLLGNDTDIDRDVLEITSVSLSVGARGFVELNENGDIVYTPALNSNRTEHIIYTVSDNADGVDTATVTVNIIPVNDAPSAAPDIGATSLDAPLILRISDLLANDSDVDLSPQDYDLLSFVGISSTSQGTASIYNDEFVVVEFAPGFSGDVTLQYTIQDEQSLQDDGTINATIGSSFLSTLTGTAIRDLIIGTSLGETIEGLDGDDDLFGRGGDDLIIGGDGADAIDGGEGFDTVSFVGSNIGVRADLDSRIGQGGDAQGDTYLNIEALSGSNFTDILNGDAADNTLKGLAGNDELSGRDGDDLIEGGEGDDLITGGKGGDVIKGGSGLDTANYFGSDQAVLISLATDLINGTAIGGDANGDVLTDIENLIGTDFDDVLNGNEQNNHLVGGRGDDLITGGAGDDTLIGGRGGDNLIGGQGFDTADYSQSNQGVSINMVDGTVGGGDGLGDTFDSIEKVVGSFHDDSLVGDKHDNIFVGGRGADLIDGGQGFDIADYSNGDEAISVDLATGFGTAGEAQGDQLLNIEMVIGSAYNDTLVGNELTNRFDGALGNDYQAGGAGSDQYLFGYNAGNDTISENGANTDIDQLILGVDINPSDLSIVRQGDDLLVELEHDDGLLIDTVLIENHFVDAQSGIEEIVFADGTIWDRAQIDTLQRTGRFNASDDVIRFADEDVALTITQDRLTSNDASENTDSLEIISVSNAQNGTVTLGANGDVVFLGANDFNGDGFFDYTIQDQFGRQSTATAEVNILPINDAPIAVNDGVFTGIEDQVLHIPLSDLIGNDIDVDGDNLSLTGTFTPLTGPDGEPLNPSFTGTNGSVSVVFGEIIFEPFANHHGFAGFAYEVADPDGLVSTGFVELNFVGVNDAPITETDEYTIKLGQTRQIKASELLANDFDIEDDYFTLISISEITNGSAILHEIGDGLADGTPIQDVIDFSADGSLGSASFVYVVEDEFGARSTGLVEITVEPINDSPIAIDDDGFSIIEDKVLIIDPSELLANDTDANNDTLVITGFVGFSDNGSVVIDGGGNIVFTPRADYNGQAGFTYVVDDGQGGSDTAFVSITVVPDNDAPVLRNDVLSGLEDLPIIIIAAEAFANDYDPDGDVIFFESTNILGALTNDFGDRDDVSENIDLTTMLIDGASSVTAALSDGSNLPDWLAFDRSDMSFTGIVPIDVTDPFDVTISFEHTNALTSEVTTYTDVLSVDPTNTQELAQGIAYDPIIIGGSLGDGSFTASLWTGRSLPNWLTFNAETRQFSIDDSLLTGAEETIRVRVAFEPDTIGQEPFSIEVAIDPSLPIDPAINQLFAGSQLFDQQNVWGLTIGADATISALKANQFDLPDWLNFDEQNLTFTGTPPAEYVGVVSVRVDIGASSQTGLPAFAYISDIVVDEALVFSDQSGFSVDLVNGEIIVTRPEDYNGSLAIEYTARDTKGAVSAEPAIIVINIAPQRELPDALNDVFSVDEDQVLVMSLADLLANDVDDDGDHIHIVSIGEVTNGQMTINIPQITFDLPNIDSLGQSAVHSAKRADGSDLPLWLSINPATGQLTGIPPLSLHETIEVVITSQDDTNTFTSNLSLDVDGNAGVTITFAGDAEFSGEAAFSYDLSDNAEGVVTANVQIEVLPLNDAPTVVDDVVDGFEDIALIISVDDLLLNDSDVDGDVLRVVSVSNASHGQVELVDGQITFTPDHNFDGQASFDYLVSDDAQGETLGHVTVNVESTNTAPNALPDYFEGLEDTPFILDPSILLGNDFDFNGDDFTFVLIEEETDNGSAFLRPDGTFSLSPRGDFSGEISFTYQITDGRLTSSQTNNIVINFLPVNDAPIAVDDIGFTTLEDQVLAIDLAVLLANDSDIDGDVLVVSQVLDPVNGSVEIIDGQAHFTPLENYFGNGGFSYQVSDGQGGVAIGYVSIHVEPTQDLPITVFDDLGTIDEDSFIDFDPAVLLVNDIDPDGDAVTFVGVDGNGLETLDSGLIRFTPQADANGHFEFSYSINDGNGPDISGTFAIDVRPLDDDPFASDDDIAGVEDQALIMPIALLIANDGDVDGHAIAIVEVIGAIGGSVQFDGVGNIVFTPNENRTGPASFEYVLEDVTGARDTAIVNIDLQSVNDAPLILPLDPIVGLEDTYLSAQLPTTSFIDVDGDVLTTSARLANGDPLPQWLTFSSQNKTFSGQPPQDFAGTLNIEVTTDDGQAQTSQLVSLTIQNVNDAPVAVDDTFAGLEDQATIIPILQLLENDSDVDGDMITITNVIGGDGFTAQLDGVGNIIITSAPDTYGELEVQYTISDGQLSSTATVNLNILAVNDAPLIQVIANEHISEDNVIAFTLPQDLATDIDGDDLTFVATRASGTALPSWLVFNAQTKQFTGTPPQNFNGTISLQVTVSDGELTSSSSFDLIVDPVNDAPVITVPLSDRFVNEDEAFNLTLQQDVFSDVDGDALSYEIAMADGSELPIWLIIDAQNLSLSGQAPQNYNGSFDLQVSADDGELSVSDIFTFTVASVNDAPVLDIPLSDTAFDDDGNDLETGNAFTISIPSTTFVDPDGDALQFAATLSDGSALPSWMTFDGSQLSGTAPHSEQGDLDIQILATDGSLQASDTFTLSFGLGNSGPVAIDDGPYNVRNGVNLNIAPSSLLENDTDEDGDALFITGVSDGAHGSVNINNNGRIIYSADTGFVGQDQFLYEITDGDATSQATVTVNVGEPYDNTQTGGSGSDVLIGDFNGDSYLFGGRGNDVLISGRGDDLLRGGAGNDLLFSGRGNDIIRGGSGNDIAFGGRGSDRINGGSGDDVLFGGRGRDTINGGSGDDILFGGRGSDTFVFRSGDGSDQILDYSTPHSGRRFAGQGDKLRLAVDGITDFDDLLATAQEQDGGVLFDLGNGDEIFLAGTQLAALDRDSFTFF